MVMGGGGDSSDDDDEFEETIDLTVDPSSHDGVNYHLLEQFVEHTNTMAKQPEPFTEDEVASIKLLALLHQKHASLDTYDGVCAWHLEAAGQKQQGIPLKECPNYVSRRRLMKKLYKRYTPFPRYKADKSPQYFLTQPTVLPVSKAKVNVIYHDHLTSTI